MADLGDDDYQYMICVEAGHVTHPVELAAGTEFCASQTMSVQQPTAPRTLGNILERNLINVIHEEFVEHYFC